MKEREWSDEQTRRELLARLEEDGTYYENLGDGVWLMDDHRWSFYVWSCCAAESGRGPFTLIHADHHFDDVNDFHDQPAGVTTLLGASVSELEGMVSSDSLIRYDSFIAPAIMRGLIREVHFYCTEAREDEHGFDASILDRHGCREHTHTGYRELAAQQFDGDVIFDLCLDLFNRSEDWAEGALWSRTEIDDFLGCMEPIIADASLVTISLSFNYSGSCDDTRTLAEIVVPRIMEIRSH